MAGDASPLDNSVATVLWASCLSKDTFKGTAVLIEATIVEGP
jgi:hypothetical protein